MCLLGKGVSVTFGRFVELSGHRRLFALSHPGGFAEEGSLMSTKCCCVLGSSDSVRFLSF